MDKNYELLALFNRVQVPDTAANPEHVAVPEAHISAFNTEIATFGYTFDASVMNKLRTLSYGEFLTVRNQIHGNMGGLSGANSRHAVLFNKFPYDVPEHRDYLLRHIISYLQNTLGQLPNDITVLSCGHAVDNKLYPDLSALGACPVCQCQVDELDSVDEAVHPLQSATPLKVVSLADPAFMLAKGTAMLARNSSLSEQEKTFLRSLKGQVTFTVPGSVFKENLPFVYDFFDDVAVIQPLLSGATDVMRIAYYVSDEFADLSLKENVRFKFTSKQSKDLLKMLEGLSNLDEDLLRNRERWLRIGERIRPGSKGNRKRFPKTAAAFDTLRQSPEKIVTFNREVELHVRTKTVDQNLIDVLSKRPGEFIRKLDFLLRTTTDQKMVLDGLRKVAKSATTKLLFETMKYLESRKENTGERVFIPKGQVTKMVVTEDKREKIAYNVLDAAMTHILIELSDRFQKLPAMGKVYLDPALRGIVVPFNRRGDSNTASPVIKGSRYPLTATDFVRLFVHWTGHLDVDLSASYLADDFSYKGHLSWTYTHDAESVHSGDIRSAPKGASEFIDFDIKKLQKRGVRYVVATVISFTGNGFNSFPCYAGYMERDALRSGKKYEPETVKVKFDITADTRSVMPLIFDLTAKEVIFADITTGGGAAQSVGSGDKKFPALARAVANLTRTKPTVYDLLEAHAISRGSLVQDPAEADLVFSLDDLDIETITAEYMA